MLERFSRKNSVADEVARLGLTFVGTVDQDAALTGIGIEPPCKDVVEFTGDPQLQWGNSGWKNWIGDFNPSRRGYVAVSHRLAAPHLYLDSTTFGALSPLNVASSVIDVLGAFDGDNGGSVSSEAQFRSAGRKLSLPKGVGFSAVVEKARADEGEEMVLRSDVMPLLSWLAQSFDVELREGWLIASSAFGDVSTADAEIWDWVFSVTSRMIDLLRLWGAEETVGTSWPGYTSQRVERPKKLDGSLSFLKRNR